MAWLALALQRADLHLGTDHRRAIGALTGEICRGLVGRRGRRHSVAARRRLQEHPGQRAGRDPAGPDRAPRRGRSATADWIDARLRDPATGLIWDGLRPGPDGGTRYETTIYSYCQGVVLGAELELARRVPDRGGVVARVSRLVAAVDARVEPPDGVLTGHAGGDSGLFGGILARYLALVARPSAR